MEKIVIVGTGDYYYRFLAPCLQHLEKEGLIEVLATVDIRQKPFPEISHFNVEHRIRFPSERISETINDLKEQNPIVILGHSNHLHIPDLQDLISNGFRVMLEKPYAVDHEQFLTLQKLLMQYPNKIALLEYYLMRKTIPVSVLAGHLKKESFYFTTEKVLRSGDFLENSTDLSGRLTDFIGQPILLNINILESKGGSGKLDHRGAHLFDTRTGGGMIQDLGAHAASFLFALRDYIGDIDLSFSNGQVKIAKCEEYSNMAIQKHQIPENYIAETYAEINFNTAKAIPVKILVGKYISDIEDTKKITIKGTKASLTMDLYDNVLYLEDNFGTKKILELVNLKEMRYYPVIRTALEALNGQNPYNIDYVSHCLDAQKFILNVLDKAKKINAVKIHKEGISPSKIFLPISPRPKRGLDYLNQQNVQSYFKDYSNYLKEIIQKIDLGNLDKISEAFLNARANNNTIFFIGNGGSASTASHFSQDLAEIGRKLGCQVFNSISLTDNISGMTAAANDYGYDKIFSFQMNGIFKKGDVLVTLSASGNSPNLIEAANFAKEKGGTVIGLLGFDGGKLLELCDYSLLVKSDKGEYEPVEDVHLMFDHILTSYFYYKLKKEMES